MSKILTIGLLWLMTVEVFAAGSKGDLQYNTNTFALSPTNVMASNVYAGYGLTKLQGAGGAITLSNLWTTNGFATTGWVGDGTNWVWTNTLALVGSSTSSLFLAITQEQRGPVHLNGDQYTTNGVYLSSSGLVNSNAAGSVTLNGGNQTNTGTLGVAGSTTLNGGLTASSASAVDYYGEQLRVHTSDIDSGLSIGAYNVDYGGYITFGAKYNAAGNWRARSAGASGFEFGNGRIGVKCDYGLTSNNVYAPTTVATFNSTGLGLGPVNPNSLLEIATSNTTSVPLTIFTNGGVAVEVTAGGAIGIGTNNPIGKLTIKGVSDIRPVQLIGFTPVLEFMDDGAGTNDTRVWSMTQDTYSYGDFGIFQATNNAVRGTAYSLPRLVFGPTGNVGLGGHTVPPEKLSVIGNVTASGSINTTNVFAVAAQPGIAATLDVLVAGSTTNRLVFVGGILVSNITTFYAP